ncbi:MAG TPA: phage portal protein, partial [Aggregatilineales bacterium]|nr:phage portal protein [Aggregatilineales bacterium]
KPRPSPKKVEESEKDLAENTQFVLNEIWMQSNARTIQLENGTYSQFLGGCVFKVEWRGTDEEARVPIYIKRIIPDHFIPVWGMDDMWNLLEAYVVYYVEETEAKNLYGVEGTRILYVEHWTPKKVTIRVGNKSIMDAPNPFGFVPFVYIPKSREGDFFGPSIVDDIEALVKEFNSRMANIGDTIRRNSQLNRFVTNLHDKTVKRVVFDRNQYFYDLGVQPNYSDAKTEMITEPPVNMPDSLVSWTQSLWTQLLRDSSLAPIVFGEDEGSQRSALTLAFRMWPLTSQVDIQRAYWDEGLTVISKMIIRMILIKMPKGINFGGERVVLPPDILRRVTFTHIWNPKIPRDREQSVNEAILMLQAGAIDPYTFHEMVGDIRDIDDVIERIISWKKRLAEFEQSMNSQPTDKGAPTEIEAPVASTDYNNE